MTVGALLGVLSAAHADAGEAGAVTGIRLSERGRLHLGLGVSTGVDTNPNVAPYWLVLSRQPSGEREALASVGPQMTIPNWAPNPNKVLFRYPPDVFVAVRPSVSVDLPTDTLHLSLNGSLNYYEYLGLLQPGYPFLPGTEAYVKKLSPLDYNTGYRRLRTLDGQVGGGLELNPKGAFGLVLTGNAIRSVDPGPIIVGTRLSRTNLNAGIVGNFRPGGGTMTFSGRLGGYAEIYDPQNGKWFDGSELPAFRDFDQFPRNMIGPGNPVDMVGLAPSANAVQDPSKFHNAGINAGVGWQWRFLPKTAVFVDGGIGSRVYLKFWDNNNASMFPISVLGGIMGNVTSKLGLVASIGLTYPLSLCIDPGKNFTFDRFNSTAACAANSGLVNGQPTAGGLGNGDVDEMLKLTPLGVQTAQYMWWAPELLRWQSLASAPSGQLEARYQLTPSWNVSGGFRRQLRFAPIYRYISDNRFYASVSGQLMQRINLGFGISESVQPHGQLTDRSVGYNTYPFDESFRAALPFLANSDPGRWDNDFLATGNVDFFIFKWLIVGLSHSFNWHLTNARTGAPNDPPGLYNEPPFNLSYIRTLTSATVQLRY
jgi:hypothetical protein